MDVFGWWQMKKILLFVLVLFLLSTSVYGSTYSDLMAARIFDANFSGSGNLCDKVNTSRCATLTNAIWVNVDYLGLDKGINFAPGDSKVVFPHNNLIPRSGNWTIVINWNMGGAGTIIASDYSAAAGELYLDTDRMIIEGGAASTSAPSSYTPYETVFGTFADESSHYKFYLNGSGSVGAEQTQNYAPTYSEFWLGARPDGSYAFNGNISLFQIFDKVLSAEEIDYIAGIPNWSEAVPSTAITDITVLAPTNGTTYNNVNSVAWINVSLDNNGSIYLNDSRWELRGTTPRTNFTEYTFLNNFPGDLTEGKYSINITANDSQGTFLSEMLYFSLDYTSPTITENINNSHFSLNMSLSVNISDPNLGFLMINNSCGNYGYYNSSLNQTSFNLSSNINLINCSLGLQHTNISFGDKAGNNQTLTYFWNSMATINITAKSIITGNNINFSIYANGTFRGNSTDDGIFLLDNLTEGYYNITIISAGYQKNSINFNTFSKIHNYTFLLYTANSLSINIRDEDTNLPINQNVTIKFTTEDLEFTNTTNLSYFYIDNLNITQYTLLFGSSGYSYRSYTVTVGNGSFQTLWAYLSKNTSTTLFTVTDKDTSESLQGVLFSMYRYINGSWATIESKNTDVSGQAQFTYMDNEQYKFYLSKSGYDDYVFYLNPILFSTYSVKMTKSTLMNYSQDFDLLSVIYAPHIFMNNNITTFNFIISSPTGLLMQYGIDLTFPGGTASTSGTNVIGEQLSVNVNIINASTFDTVKLEYYYITSISGRRNFTVLLPIGFITGDSNLTFWANKDKTYGLGVFERILIITIIIIFVVGIAMLVGQPVPGFALGLFVFGYSVRIGFISPWAILPSMFIGFMFLVWKSGGY